MDPNPYRSVILDYVLEHGNDKRVLVPMQASVLVELLAKGNLQRDTLQQVAYDFAARERARNSADLQHRIGRDFVFAVSTEANLAASKEAKDFEEKCLRELLRAQEEKAYAEQLESVVAGLDLSQNNKRQRNDNDEHASR